jgi:hypothetical protein
MKNLFKYSMVAAATMTLAGSVYAIPTVVITDGSGGTISAIGTSASGVVTVTTSDGFWSVVVATGISSPPALGQGTPSNPTMDLSITATYIGPNLSGTGNPLTISFGSDGFGPSSGNIVAELTGHMISGTGNAIGFKTIDASGSVLPTTGSPAISGTTLTTANVLLGSGPNNTYFSELTGGPINLANYSIDEVVTLTGNPGGSAYSIDASLEVVPDGGMTLVLLGSALSGLALIKRKLA